MNAHPAMLLCLFTLAGLLAAALWHDLRSRRIPNRLVLCGTLAGLLLNTAVPAGSGLFDPAFGGLGLLQALAGAGAGLALLLPMYLLRALGAGDVKLMAMCGAFLGPLGILEAVLLTCLAGGVLALAAALAGRRLRQVLKNTCDMLLGALLHSLAGGVASIAEPPAASGRLAYAFAIASGTGLQLFLHYTQLWSLR
ncbi:prepilin peptidase [Janthinobacterium lividum]|uniref:prepilin peptidase n=1 Tax=Janthinobacterium lividum TaxID=29581 RepID=UPI0008930C07|nr:A24 family peptidase [Janthinobacterium lividum]OEZ47039.1 type IV leader peptidase family protein [Janthinobacterium lividum]WQE27892.1 A24 family peptidase [Janthinobacterium lividum]STQ98815.1 Flp pilus assembly protein, protease CpaA [Janthinobacterium lividum]